MLLPLVMASGLVLKTSELGEVKRTDFLTFNTTKEKNREIDRQNETELSVSELQFLVWLF